MSSFVFPKYDEGDEIKGDKMGGTCTTYGERKNVCRGFRRNPKERNHLEKERSRWKNNIKTFFEEIGRVDVDRVHVAQCRNKWWAVVNAVMTLRDPQNARSFWLPEELLASQE